jgi:hypothetical protein
MNGKLDNEIRELLKSQPRLEIFESKDKYDLTGIYQYSLNYNNYIAQGERQIKFSVKKNFPNSIPKFYVFTYPKNIEHIYKNGNVCLAAIGEMLYFLNENPSLEAFIDKFVDAFIFTLHWFERYGIYPFGDREHGYKGLLDYYLNDLRLTFNQYKIMVYMIYNNQYRGHHSCLCGSGKTLRSCHGKFMLPIIQNDSHRQEFLQEASLILTEDGKNV